MRNHFSHVHFRVLYKRKMVDKCMEVFYMDDKKYLGYMRVSSREQK